MIKNKVKILPLSGNKGSGKTSYRTRAKADLQYMMYASPFIRCDKCKDKLGLLHMLRYSIRTRKGSIYVVDCKSCGYLNERTKGGLADEFNKRWE